MESLCPARSRNRRSNSKRHAGLDGKPLVEFAGKCLFTGLAGSLTDTKRDLSRTLVDWSATSDPIARARLGAMRDIVREKAGYAGTNRNVIRRVDVLAALDVSDVDELLPCPASLPKVGKVVEREQLAEAIALIPKLDKPLLIHAAGGVGKTVFLDSLTQSTLGTSTKSCSLIVSVVDVIGHRRIQGTFRSVVSFTSLTLLHAVVSVILCYQATTTWNPW